MGRKTRLTGTIGAAAIALVGAWEGLRLTAYRDVVGVPTVCYGETLGVKLGDKHTKAECDAMLLASLEKHEAGMRKCLKSPDAIPARSYVAFVSLTYNIGVGAFCRSTARKRLDAGDVRGACEAATWFKKAGGKTIPGLVNRRAAEHEICLAGLDAPKDLETVSVTPKPKPPAAVAQKTVEEPAPDYLTLGLLAGFLFVAGLAVVLIIKSRRGVR